MTIKKLEGNIYEVKETTTGTEQTSHVDKFVLEEAIRKLEADISKRNELLAYKENLLIEINKIK